MRLLHLFPLALLAAPMVFAAESQTVVTAPWLAQHRTDPHLVIVDARPEAEYAKGHIPGAVLVNALDNLVESTPQGEKVFHDWLAETFSRAGIGSQDEVIVYEEKLGMQAARAYWMLCYAGQPTVKMLEGGFATWRAGRGPVATEAVTRAATKYRLKPQKKYMATAQEVAALRSDRKALILDVRTREEYEGKKGATDCARQGRIPGAVWVEWSEFLSADGTTLQSPEKLGVLLMEKGITPNKQIVTYCHQGARAAMVWAALDDLGFPKVKNYVGSWHDWAAKKELPAE